MKNSFKKVVRLKRRRINIPLTTIIQDNNITLSSTDLPFYQGKMGVMIGGGAGINQDKYVILYVNKNKRITEENIKVLKKEIIILNIRLIINPNKLLTKKGILIRMGRGKGKLITKAIYLPKGSIIAGGKYNPSILPKLDKYINKFTYLSYKFLP